MLRTCSLASIVAVVIYIFTALALLAILYRLTLDCGQRDGLFHPSLWRRNHKDVSHQHDASHMTTLHAPSRKHIVKRCTNNDNSSNPNPTPWFHRKPPAVRRGLGKRCNTVDSNTMAMRRRSDKHKSQHHNVCHPTHMQGCQKALSRPEACRRKWLSRRDHLQLRNEMRIASDSARDPIVQQALDDARARIQMGDATADSYASAESERRRLSDWIREVTASERQSFTCDTVDSETCFSLRTRHLHAVIRSVALQPEQRKDDMRILNLLKWGTTVPRST
jgi:hypothetical protein